MLLRLRGLRFIEALVLPSLNDHVVASELRLGGQALEELVEEEKQM